MNAKLMIPSQIISVPYVLSDHRNKFQKHAKVLLHPFLIHLLLITSPDKIIFLTETFFVCGWSEI